MAEKKFREQGLEKEEKEQICKDLFWFGYQEVYKRLFKEDKDLNQKQNALGRTIKVFKEEVLKSCWQFLLLRASIFYDLYLFEVGFPGLLKGKAISFDPVAAKAVREFIHILTKGGNIPRLSDIYVKYLALSGNDSALGAIYAWGNLTIRKPLDFHFKNSDNLIDLYLEIKWRSESIPEMILSEAVKEKEKMGKEMPLSALCVKVLASKNNGIAQEILEKEGLWPPSSAWSPID